MSNRSIYMVIKVEDRIFIFFMGMFMFSIFILLFLMFFRIIVEIEEEKRDI